MRRMRSPADVDIEWGPDRRGRFVDGPECDPDSKRGRHRPASHMSGLVPAQQDRVAVPRDPPIVHTDPDEPPIIVPRPLPLERLASEERPIPFHEPGGIHFERRLMAIEILTGQEVSFLEAQGVASPEADRADAEVLPGWQAGPPHREALARGREQPQPRRAGRPGPRREEAGPSSGKAR